MKTDKYTKLILTAIAVGLILNAGVNIIEPARADDDVIIQRILFCIDGSTISDGSFSTYCNSQRQRATLAVKAKLIMR